MSLDRYLHFNGTTWECLLCERTFNSKFALFAHCEYTSRHEWCAQCQRVFTSFAAKNSHLKCATVHQLRCKVCDRAFRNENDWRMHQQTHQPRDQECYADDCTMLFKTFSGMLIHLESGSCPSGVDEDRVDYLARSYYNRTFAQTDSDGAWRYMCPGCERVYRTLSGLFQHAEDAVNCGRFMAGSGCLERVRQFIEDYI
ncbi:hypothetical protein BBP40_006326 [Aspergillus hancockii]|nr:hypothetical protein BBP40_006326 [Aspergillus hancockii]